MGRPFFLCSRMYMAPSPCAAGVAISTASRFPLDYFISKKSYAFDDFRTYKVWVENLTGHSIGIMRGDKCGGYLGADLHGLLMECGIWREDSFRDTPQQLGSLNVVTTRHRKVSRPSFRSSASRAFGRKTGRPLALWKNSPSFVRN